MAQMIVHLSQEHRKAKVLMEKEHQKELEDLEESFSSAVRAYA